MALIDEESKENYKRYGNPDGPQVLKVAIGLPRFLLDEKNHVLILVVFSVILLFLIPLRFLVYFWHHMQYAESGVKIDTVQFMAYYVGSTTKVEQGPELLATSSECREIGIKGEHLAELVEMQDMVVDYKEREYLSSPFI